MADADRLRDWTALVDDLYPPADAEGWDAVGLHVGDAERDTVGGVLVTLDVTTRVIDEARAMDADLVVAHHPLLLRPLARLTPETAAGRIALHAARHGVAIHAAHTNLDRAVDGTSVPAADVLGLVDRQPLVPLDDAPAVAVSGLVKLVTFVPRRYSDVVVRAMAAAGGGTIGAYTECAFTVAGTGTFRPGEGAEPTVGARGQREHVPEDRIEMLLPADRTADVVAALRRAHPYEEVAFDLYPLVDPPAQEVEPHTHAFDETGEDPADPSPRKGLGLIGTLPAPTSLLELAARLRDELPSPTLRLAADDPDRLVSTVAVVGGAGDSTIDRAIAAGADLLVTADLRHHVTLDALTRGLASIDAGHFWTENPAMDTCRTRLEAAATARGLRAPVHRSRIVTDPWTTGAHA